MMASFSFPTFPTITTTKVKTNSYRFKAREKLAHPLKASFNATPTPDENDRKLRTSIDIQNIDRRNFILGLSSLIGTTSNLISLSPVFAQTALEKGSKIADKFFGEVKKVEDMELPLKLDQTVKVLVKRPAVNRTKEEKAKAIEILSVKGVNVSSEKYVKFDVIVNVEDDETAITAADSEFAGSFALLPYKRRNTMITSGARFGITELLEDIKAEDDEYILVSLVPRTGCEDATVSEIKIDLVPVV